MDKNDVNRMRELAGIKEDMDQKPKTQKEVDNETAERIQKAKDKRVYELKRRKDFMRPE